MSDGPVVDVHVHLISGDPALGCHVDPKLERGIVFSFLLRYLGLDPREHPRALEQAYIDRLVEQLRASEHVSHAVLLPLDAVYQRDGTRDPHTAIEVSDEAVLAAARQAPELLPACSVHPYRTDALEALDRAAAAGAVLCKWLPNTQGMDPADPLCVPFYRRLAELGIPLLSHCGREHTLPVIDQSWGDPARLRPALEAGATVIVAHGGSSTLAGTRRTFATFCALVEEFDRCYADLSAMLTMVRGKTTRWLLDRPELHERLLYGSDYPIPAGAWTFVDRLGLAGARRVHKTSNPLDRSAVGLRAMGFPDAVFRRAPTVLGPGVERWLATPAAGPGSGG